VKQPYRDKTVTLTHLTHGRLHAGARGARAPALDSDLKKFLERCAIAVIKINAGNADIKSHNTEV